MGRVIKTSGCLGLTVAGSEGKGWEQGQRGTGLPGEVRARSEVRMAGSLSTWRQGEIRSSHIYLIITNTTTAGKYPQGQNGTPASQALPLKYYLRGH